MAVAVPHGGPVRRKRSFDCRSTRSVELITQPYQRSRERLPGGRLECPPKAGDDRHRSRPVISRLPRGQSPKASTPHVTACHSAEDQEQVLHTGASHTEQQRNGTPAHKRKRNTASSNEGTELDDLSDSKKPNKKQKSSILQQEGLGKRFACPYYKKDPEKYKSWRTCPGPGWQTVHRMKEHLYRRHQRKRHACPRCFKTFSDKKGLDSHVRAEIPCAIVVPRPFPDEFDEAVAAQLQSRRKHITMSESDRWFDVFKILFGDAELPASPYYDHPQSTDTNTVKCSTGDISLSTYLTALQGNWDDLRSRISRALQDEMPVGLTAARQYGTEQRLLQVVQSFLSSNLGSVSSPNVSMPFVFDTGLEDHSQHVDGAHSSNFGDAYMPHLSTLERPKDTDWLVSGMEHFQGPFTDQIRKIHEEADCSLPDLEL